MVASFQSTRDPFIQILPVPGKAICNSFLKILYGDRELGECGGIITGSGLKTSGSRRLQA
jgi:hypothetical protein